MPAGQLVGIQAVVAAVLFVNLGTSDTVLGIHGAMSAEQCY